MCSNTNDVFTIENDDNVPYVVDFRSDTISRPTKAMREAMFIAEVGDDVMGEDPTVNKLEKQACEMLGKEAALFLPSGTMANLISVMLHCSRRGSEAIVGDKSHVYLFEQAGAAQIAGVQLVLVKNKSDGTFDLDEVESRIRKNPDCHEPLTSLIIVENTHNMCGGKILPIEWLDKLNKLARMNNIALHMDGARIFNASVASNVPAKEIAKYVDSVCFCLSKNLGAPVGSLLLGSTEFIKQARRMRKVLGGGMRQAGVIAACGLVALDEMIDRLAEDHRRTYKIAKALHDLNSDMFKIDLDNCKTNILMIALDTSKVKGSEFLKRMKTVSSDETENVIVKLGCRNEGFVRVTIYYEITDLDVDIAIRKLIFVIREFESRNVK